MDYFIQTKKVESVKIEDLNQRLDYAKYLLVQTVEPLATIAASGGWRNRKTFAEEFERLVGVSPEAYRRWHQEV